MTADSVEAIAQREGLTIRELILLRIREQRGEPSRTTKHGHTVGGAYTPTYGSWTAMRTRCLNRKHVAWARYGGRGITVCERWSDFRNFFADMGKRPIGKTLHRLDNDKGYFPANCIWATPREQNAKPREKRAGAR
jgi:hypothetical protein